MDTDQLLQQLSSEGAKKPLMHPLWQTIFWFAGVLVYLAIFIFFMGFRSDVTYKLMQFNYLLELCLLLALGAVSAMAAFYLSRPDIYQQPWIKYVPLIFLIPCMLISLADINNQTGSASGGLSMAQSLASGHLDCPWHIFIFSILPVGTLFFVVKTGATTASCWAGSMATLSVTAFAYMLMRLVEQNDDPAHLLIWHIVPIALMCVIGLLTGRIILKWHISCNSR